MNITSDVTLQRLFNYGILCLKAKSVLPERRGEVSVVPPGGLEEKRLSAGIQRPLVAPEAQRVKLFYYYILY